MLLTVRRKGGQDSPKGEKEEEEEEEEEVQNVGWRPSSKRPFLKGEGFSKGWEHCNSPGVYQQKVQ